MKRTELKRHTPLRSGQVKLRVKHAMTPARKAARGKPCMIRLPGCDGGGETTVLAHYRLAGTCGTGMKPPDILGAWACHHCHMVVDGHELPEPGYLYNDLRLAHAEGMMRTILLRGYT